MLNNLAKESFTHVLSNGLLDRTFNDAIKTKSYLQLAQITSEIGEAHNALRAGNSIEFAEEVADIIIATLTLAWMNGIDVDKQVSAKLEYNRRRLDHAGTQL